MSNLFSAYEMLYVAKKLMQYQQEAIDYGTGLHTDWQTDRTAQKRIGPTAGRGL